MKLTINTGYLLVVACTLAFSNVLQASDQTDVNKIRTSEIQKLFKKQLSSRLNQKNCEKKLFLKKAKFNTGQQQIIVDFTTRLTRQYCTRRAKKQLYEKTKAIRFSYEVMIKNGVVELTESNAIEKQYKFEQSLTDIIGKNSKKAIAEMLLDIIGLNSENNQQIDSVEVNSQHIIVRYKAAQK